MAVLTIEGTTVPVREGGHSVRHMPLAPTERIYDGSLMRAITSNRGHFRTWRIETVEMDLTDAETIEALLDNSGSLTCSGDFCQDTGDVESHPRNVRRSMDESTDRAVVSFDLEETDPT